jgi:hypothetical protein
MRKDENTRETETEKREKRKREREKKGSLSKIETNSCW